MALANPQHLALGSSVESNQRVWAVFKELVYRQGVLFDSKRQEIRWRTSFLVGCLVTTTVILPMLFPSHRIWVIPFWLYIALIVCDFLVLARFRRSQRALLKASINFGVLRHHLIGMLEVELCNCPDPCQCKQEFCREAMIRYGVNLYQ